MRRLVKPVVAVVVIGAAAIFPHALDSGPVNGPPRPASTVPAGK